MTGKRKNGKTYFTEASVRRMKSPASGQDERFEKLRRGLTLVLRLSYGGTKAWRVLYYTNGRPHAKTLGHYPELGVAAARKAAFDFDPHAASAAAQAGSFKDVAENWIKHYVDRKKLRSKDEIARQLNAYVYPRWAQMPFFEIRRKTVNELLDSIEDENGAPQADGVLATIRSICNWYQSRDENYVSPIVKGMKRDQRKAAERARTRTLNDDEIRAVWKAADSSNTFGAIVKLLLLTAQRREKVATMKWTDVSAEGVWNIPLGHREKGNAGALRLPQAAVDVINAQPIIDDNPYVFAGSIRGRRHGKTSGPPAFNSWSQRKAELDAKLPQTMAPWTLHDLRRTARSLVARVGVNDAVAERVLGHAIAGVEGVYNRHNYIEEKAAALARLATLIGGIVNPPDKTNVVAIADHT